MCHECICLSVEMLSHLKIILFTHNQFQLCCLKYWRIPSPLHCHCQPTSISYLCLCILQNVRILIIFISSVSTNSRLQLSCGLVCGVSAVSGLIQKWIEGNLQTHSPAHTQNTNSHDNSSIDPCHNTGDERTTKVYIVEVNIFSALQTKTVGIKLVVYWRQMIMKNIFPQFLPLLQLHLKQNGWWVTVPSSGEVMVV